MNGFIKKILLLFIWVLPTLGNAQNISVASFKLLENDLTANTTGTMERDQNGEVAALIKVVTTEQGFVFDGGMSGIVKTKQGVGEVWVYVPYGIKRITIQHGQLGVLRDYYFPVPIEKGKSYEMVLTTGKVETIVSRSAGKQYVIFSVAPANAVVELDGMPLEVVDGYAEKSMAYGDYDYRVSCANYHAEVGKLTVSSAGKVEKSVSLRPNFGWIDFIGADDYRGAHVYIDDERVGQLPMKSDVLKSGIYRVKVLKPLYKPFEQQVTVTDNHTTSLNVVLVPNFANITLTTDAESEIWIDGRQRGKGKCTLGLELGEYTVEVKRPSHRTVSDVITVSEIADRTIVLSSPAPIYGILDISSTPSRATVFVDGVEMGQTPLILDNVLVGNREIRFIKEGYMEQTKIANIVENKNNQVFANLEENPKEVMVNITSTPNRAAIEIEGKYVGRTPIDLPVKFGYYDLVASKKGYLSSNLYSRKIDQTLSKVHFNMTKITKPRNEKPYNNRYYNGLAAYIDVNAEYFKDTFGVGVIGGFYCGGFDVEFAYQKSLYNDFVMRGGIGFRLGKNILLTPQVGMHIFWGIPVYTSDYWEKEDTDCLCLSLSCRAQYCFTKNLALSITPEYVFPATDEYGSYDKIIGSQPHGVYIRAGLTINFGSNCDDVSEFW